MKTLTFLFFILSISLAYASEERKSYHVPPIVIDPKILDLILDGRPIEPHEDPIKSDPNATCPDIQVGYKKIQAQVDEKMFTTVLAKYHNHRNTNVKVTEKWATKLPGLKGGYIYVIYYIHDNVNQDVIHVTLAPTSELK